MADQFRQFRGAADGTYFALGDCIDAWVVEMAGKLSAARIYRTAATETDLSVAGVRKLHETARATDASLRAEFADVLCHEHFSAVRYVDDRARQHAYLKLAVESADDWNGRPMPAAKLAERVRRDNGGDPPPTFGQLLDRAHKALERARDACEDERRHDALNRIIEQVERLL